MVLHQMRQLTTGHVQAVTALPPCVAPAWNGIPHGFTILGSQMLWIYLLFPGECWQSERGGTCRISFGGRGLSCVFPWSLEALNPTCCSEGNLALLFSVVGVSSVDTRKGSLAFTVSRRFSADHLFRFRGGSCVHTCGLRPQPGARWRPEVPRRPRG